MEAKDVPTAVQFKIWPPETKSPNHPKTIKEVYHEGLSFIDKLKHVVTDKEKIKLKVAKNCTAIFLILIFGLTQKMEAKIGKFDFSFNSAGIGGKGLIYKNPIKTDNNLIPTACSTTPTLSLTSKTNVTCVSGNDGSITVSATGGGGLSYLWSNGATSTTIGTLIAGVYTCTVTNNCPRSATISVTIAQPTVNPTVSASSSQTNVSCFGGSNGSASISASGGTGFTYSWSPGGGTSSIKSGLSAITYSCVVKNSCLSSTTIAVAITQPSSAVSVIAGASSTICLGATASLSASASGGTGPYTYNWMPGNLAGPTNTVAPIADKTYTVTASDAAACASTAIQIVTVINPAVTASISAKNNVTCNGLSNGSATISASGGSSFTYSWSPTGGASSIATGLGANTYSCVVKNNCNNAATVTVSITQPLPITIIAGSSSTICLGSVATLSASASGGTGSFTYNWLPGSLSGANQSVSPSVNTTYTVIATDANACASSAVQMVTVINPAITASVSAQNNVTCNGLSNGSATISASGGSGITYSWSPSGGTSSIASGLSAGIYTFVATNSCGTSVSIPVNITEPSPIVLIAGATSTICAGSTASISASATGGSGSFTYSWMPGSLVGANQSVSTSVNSTYTVTATDANACASSATQMVIVSGICPMSSVPCGNSYVNLNSYSTCKPVNGATSYRFSFYDNMTNALVAVKTQTSYIIYFNTVIGLKYNKTYKWTVSVDNGFGFGPESSNVCNITFNAPQTTVPCGNSYSKLNSYSVCKPIDQATNYRFSFYDNTTNALLAVKTQTSYIIYFNTVTGLKYNKTYNWTVEVEYNDPNTGTLLFGPASSNSCTITFNDPQTTVPCGNAYADLNSYSVCKPVDQATNYRFSFYDNTTNALLAVKTQTSYIIYFNTVVGLTYNKIYKWTVEVEYNDPNTGTLMFGPASSNSCTITFNAPQTTVPCGNSYSKLNTYSVCQPIDQATNYRFSFYDNTTNALLAVKTQTSYIIYFNTVTGLEYNKTYKWTVETEYNDPNSGTLIYGPSSSNSCTITFSAPKTTVPCGNSYPNLNSYSVCQPIYNATNYRFSFYDNTTNALVATKTQTSNIIYFNTVTGLTFNNTYKWAVEVEYNDPITSTFKFGPPCSNNCTVTWGTPASIAIGGNNGTARIAKESFNNNDQQFLINLFPNPTKDKITVEASEAINKITVYNISGELILSKETTNEIDLSNLKAGLYIISVETENNTKHFEIIKE